MRCEMSKVENLRRLDSFEKEK